jgi:cell division protein FtsQ
MRENVLPFPHAPSFGRIRLRALLPSGRALLVGFGLLAGGALAYFGARETSLFAVRSIEIAGAPPRVAAHVRAALRPLEGKSLLALHASDVGRRLEGLSDVAGVTYDRDFPHTLRLVVTPAHSIAVVRRGPAAWIVSSDGRVVREAGLFAAPRLPRVWVPRVTDVDVGSTIADADAARAIQAVASARAAGFGAKIAAIRSNDHELTFVLVSGPELRFGDASALRTKLAVARQLLPLAADSGYVDVSVPERPVSGHNPQD